MAVLQTRSALFSLAAAFLLASARSGAGEPIARLNEDGRPRLAVAPLVGRWTPEGQPVCTVSGAQDEASGIPDGTGGAILVWRDVRSGSGKTYSVRLDIEGNVVAGWTSGGSPVCTGTADETSPAVVADGAGGAIVGWIDVRDGNGAIYAQRLTASGQPEAGWPAEGLRVCSAGAQYAMSMHSDGIGGAVFAARDVRNNNPVAVFAHRIAGDGTVPSGWPAGGLGITQPFSVHQLRAGPYVIGDGAGGGYVAYLGYAPPPCVGHGCGPEQYYHQLARFLASGTIPWRNGYANAHPFYGPTLASDGAGGLLFGQDQSSGLNLSYIHPNGIGDWTVLMPSTISPMRTATDGANGVIAAQHASSNSGVIAMRLRPNGSVAPGWNPAGTVISPGGLYRPVLGVAPDQAGGGYFLWQDHRDGPPDLYAARMSANGTVAPGWTPNGNPVNTLRGATAAARMFSDGLGGAIVVWTDHRAGNADIYAQRLFGEDPVPVLASLQSAEATSTRVRLTWYTPLAAGRDFGVFRQSIGSEWQRLGGSTADGSGRLVFEDRDVRPGTRYGYRIALTEEGEGEYLGETWIDVPASLVFGLEGPRPNPVADELVLDFTLPTGDPARMEVLDMAGRLLHSRDVGALGPGRHLVRMDGAREFPAGVFLVRLTQRHQSRTAKVVFIR